MGMSTMLPDNCLHTIRVMWPARMRGIVPIIEERNGDE